jgi:hypothetical protein
MTFFKHAACIAIMICLIFFSISSGNENTFSDCSQNCCTEISEKQSFEIWQPLL